MSSDTIASFDDRDVFSGSSDFNSLDFKRRFLTNHSDPLDLNCNARETTIAVAMSGGVDSAVTAALIKKAGYKVIGLTMQLYDSGKAAEKPGSCCAGVDIHDARRVAQQIDIAHYVLDYQSIFKERVIDSFADSYFSAKTPIPCIACNRQIKFRDLLEMSLNLGAKALVTGHYAVIRRFGDDCHLHRALDCKKDQSYFLFNTTKEQLRSLRFPLGDISKSVTRSLASELGLKVADKPDSQDICFIPKGHYTDLLKKLRPNAASPGDIVDLDGNILGRHDGIIHFTIGQRRGLGIGGGEPFYVVDIDADSARVIVDQKRHDLSDKLPVRLYLDDFNWLGDGIVSDCFSCDVHIKLRSTQSPVAGRLYHKADDFFVEIAESSLYASPGQACVLYEGGEGGTRVLGGGFISKKR